mgnify:CR=1 FL=1
MKDFLNRLSEPFLSASSRWNGKCKRTIISIYPVLQGMDNREISFMLDTSVDMKNLLIIGTSNFSKPKTHGVAQEIIRIPEAVFTDPGIMPEQVKFESLEIMLKIMIENPVIAGALTMWSLSICAMTFAEDRYDGKKIWKECSRGFDGCKVFRSDEDIPLGLDEF